jgi:hypothetical protein
MHEKAVKGEIVFTGSEKVSPFPYILDRVKYSDEKYFFTQLGEICPNQETLDMMFYRARCGEEWLKSLKTYLCSDQCFWLETDKSVSCKFNRTHIPSLLKIKWGSDEFQRAIRMCMPSMWSDDADLLEFYLQSKQKQMFIGLAIIRPTIFDRVFKAYSACTEKQFYHMRYLLNDERLTSDLKYLPRLGNFVTVMNGLAKYPTGCIPVEKMIPELLGFCSE